MTGFASFRDPSGQLKVKDGRVIRLLLQESVPVIRETLSSPWYRSEVERGAMTASMPLEPPEADALWPDRPAGSWLIEHPPVFFPTYPYEWTFGMLADAARLTLRLARGLLSEDRELKDATPYNILFQGVRPAFVDIPSLEPRSAHSPIWRAQAQFIRTFLLPLHAVRRFRISLAQIFLADREGLDPRAAYRMATWTARLRPAFFTLVTLPEWLGSLAERLDARLHRPDMLRMDPERARAVLAAMLGRLERKLPAPPAPDGASPWSTYMADMRHYSAEDFRAKEDLVREVVGLDRPATLLDIGANTGNFSRLAAAGGAKVVAVEKDPVAAEAIRTLAIREGLDILPVVMDLSRPSPAMGWRNLEQPAFLDRAEGRFEMILMLAVVHHLMVTEGIPLAELVRLAALLCTKTAVIEYVDPSDPKFRQLTRGREALHAHLTPERFEAALGPHFSVRKKLALAEGRRILYVCQKTA